MSVFVIPVKTGIQVSWSGDNDMNLDSGFRRSDEVDEASTWADWRSVELFLGVDSLVLSPLLIQSIKGFFYD